MSCNCSGCQRAKQISTLRQLQPDDGRCTGNSGKYPSKSKKVYMDRYLAARKNLLLYIDWYKQGYEQRKTTSSKMDAAVPYYHDRIKRKSWGVKRYCEARAKVKKLGLI